MTASFCELEDNNGFGQGGGGPTMTTRACGALIDRNGSNKKENNAAKITASLDDFRYKSKVLLHDAVVNMTNNNINFVMTEEDEKELTFWTTLSQHSSTISTITRKSDSCSWIELDFQNVSLPIIDDETITSNNCDCDDEFYLPEPVFDDSVLFSCSFSSTSSSSFFSSISSISSSSCESFADDSNNSKLDNDDDDFDIIETSDKSTELIRQLKRKAVAKRKSSNKPSFTKTSSTTNPTSSTSRCNDECLQRRRTKTQRKSNEDNRNPTKSIPCDDKCKRLSKTEKKASSILLSSTYHGEGDTAAIKSKRLLKSKNKKASTLLSTSYHGFDATTTNKSKRLKEKKSLSSSLSISHHGGVGGAAANKNKSKGLKAIKKSSSLSVSYHGGGGGSYTTANNSRSKRSMKEKRKSSSSSIPLSSSSYHGCAAAARKGSSCSKHNDEIIKARCVGIGCDDFIDNNSTRSSSNKLNLMLDKFKSNRNNILRQSSSSTTSPTRTASSSPCNIIPLRSSRKERKKLQIEKHGRRDLVRNSLLIATIDK